MASREWSPADDNISDTLNILEPIEKTLRNSLPDQGQSFYGEFAISLNKVNGSLGFTLRQMDDTILKHTIKVKLFDIIFEHLFIFISGLKSFM